MASTIWSDPTIAAAFANATGLPAYVGTFNETTETAPGVEGVRVEVDGHVAAAFSRAAGLPDDSTSPPRPLRFAWAWHAGIGVLDWKQTQTHSQEAAPAGNGAFGEPTLWHRTMGANFAGRVDRVDPWVIEAKLGFYEDVYCKVPSNVTAPSV